MIVTFTDFGVAGPYLGQVRLALAREAPGVPVVDLLADAPAFQVRAGAYLLAALAADLPPGTVCLGVVDPGVGTERRPVVVEADGRWFVGPDNGLFHVLARRASRRERWEVLWRPERLARTFHGRDLFAPVAARIARGDWPAVRRIDGPEGEPTDRWPEDLAAVVYVDPYGNAMTGTRASVIAPGAVLSAGGRRLERAGTFADVEPGHAFWYENSVGLAEIAVNQASAARTLGLAVGSPVRVS